MEGESSRFLVNDFASEEEKASEEFAVHTMQNFWMKFNTNNFFNNRAVKYREIRAWAEGNQPVQYLIDQTITRQAGGDPNSSWLNLDYTPPAILPIFVDGMVGDFMKMRYKVKCNAIDPDSVNKKLQKKNEELNLLRFKPLLEDIEKTTGIPTPKTKFETEEEINVEHENFKLGIEEAVEEAVQNVLETCNIESIQRRLFYDLVNLKMAVVRCYYDINYKTKFEYIDPELYVSSTNLKEDFSDVNIEGHIEFMTIGELKRQSGYDNETLYLIAQKYAGQLGNVQTIGAYQVGLLDSQYTWYSNLIMVFHFRFLTIDNEVYKVKENRYGKKRIYKGEARTTSENALVKRIQNVYEGNWVVSSDYVYGYQKAENMVRPRIDGAVSTETQTGYFKFAPNMRYGINKSHTERAIVYAKQWHLAFLKIQHFLSKAKPPGYKINISGMRPVDLGDGQTEFDPLAMQIFHEQTGSYIYDSDGEGGINSMSKSPLEPFAIPIGEIEKLINVCNFNLEQIRQVCGRPVGVDTSTPSPDTLVGVVNASRNSAMVSLEPLRQGFTNIMKNSINYLSMMIQDKVTGSYGMAIGDMNVKLLEMGKELQLATLGIDIEYEPDEVEKNEIRMTLDYEVKTGGLSSEDALYIKSLSNVKQMARVMKVKRAQKVKQQQELAAANSQMQAKASAEAAQAAEAARMQTELAILKAKEALIWTQAFADIEVNKSKAATASGQAYDDHVRTLAELALQSQIKLNQPPMPQGMPPQEGMPMEGGMPPQGMMPSPQGNEQVMPQQ